MRLAVGRLQAQRHERLIEIHECIARPDLHRARFNTVRGEPVSLVEAPRAHVVGNDSELDNLYAARAGVRQEGCHDHIIEGINVRPVPGVLESTSVLRTNGLASPRVAQPQPYPGFVACTIEGLRLTLRPK